MFGIDKAYLFGAVFIAGGLFSLGLGLREFLRWRRLLRHGLKTRGVAAAVTDDDNGVSLTAVFADETGARYKIFSRGGDSAWRDLDGREIEILYERGRPKQARMVVDLHLRTGLAVYWFGILFILIGVVPIVLHWFGIEVVTE
jgi:hypothetical protein